MPNSARRLGRARSRRHGPSPHPPGSASFPPVIAFVFWAAVAVCAIAQVFIIAGAVRAKAPGAGVASFSRSSRAIEIGWTIVPAIALALILIFTYRAIERAADAAPMPRVVDSR